MSTFHLPATSPQGASNAQSAASLQVPVSTDEALQAKSRAEASEILRQELSSLQAENDELKRKVEELTKANASLVEVSKQEKRAKIEQLREDRNSFINFVDLVEHLLRPKNDRKEATRQTKNAVARIKERLKRQENQAV